MRRALDFIETVASLFVSRFDKRGFCAPTLQENGEPELRLILSGIAA
jgi:hypothetical protein